MLISCIVATSKNGVIGKDNDIPWYLPADLKYFKKITSGHHIVMGRKCYQSIGRPLPNRTNIVLTRDPYFMSSNILVAHSIEEGLQIAHDNGESECFIIGGGKIYDQSRSLWDKVYLTEVEVEVDGDVYFDKLDPLDWNQLSEEKHLKDAKNDFDYTFKVFTRK